VAHHGFETPWGLWGTLFHLSKGAKHMNRPTLTQYMLEIAKLAATRTTCIRRGVGCVLVNQRGHILAVGYNGVAKGMPHCNEPTDDGLCWDTNEPVQVVSGHACKGHDLPPGQDSCEAVHAEQNALLQCSDPWSVEVAYVTLSPCKACLKLLLSTSCKRIVVLEEHVDPMPKELWLRSGREWEVVCAN
jgi:dCMP deaminase